MSIEHEKTVLGAIIPVRRDLLDTARIQLTDLHFTDLTMRNLFLMLERYADATGAVLTADALHDLVTSAETDAGNALLYTEMFAALSSASEADSDFLWAITQMQDGAATTATNRVLTESMQVLTRGLEVGTGRNRLTLRGHEDARQHVQVSLSRIEQELKIAEAPAGDVKEESVPLMDEYEKAKQLRLSGGSAGVLFGIPELDTVVGGLQPGSMSLIAAYSGEGKSTMCVQLAWCAAIMQGYNVYFATSETLRTAIRRKLISRHSKLEAFGLPDGLDSAAIKAGSLNPQEEEVLRAVMHDLEHNQNYGKLYVAQVPRGTSIATLEAHMTRVQRQFPIGLVVVDYLALLSPGRNRNSEREELSETLKMAKVMAASFNNGEGVPLVSPWQVSRNARTEAEKVGGYVLSSLSDSSEAEKSSDLVATLLRPQSDNRRIADVTLQVLKQRDGLRTGSAIQLALDYATSSFFTRGLGQDFGGLVQ